MSETQAAPVRLRTARGFVQRLRGLLWSAHLEPDCGLLIPHCRAVHTFGMRYSIDIVFLDADRRVLRIDRSVRPMRMRACWRARTVIELCAHRAASLGLEPGQHLSIPAR